MAKVNFNDIANQPTNEGGEHTSSGVRFFALKPNESAIVRILCDSVDDLDIHTVHNVVTPQWQYGKRMNCLREAYDPMEACPLCMAGKPLTQKLFIKMLMYVTDPQNNQITVVPTVWERSVNDKVYGARALMSLMETYGPLSKMLCKITRIGEKLDTQYQFGPNLPPHVYPESLYPAIIPENFNNYSVIGTAMVLNKTAEEYTTFLTTGNFPNPNAQATPKNEPPVSIPPATNTPAYGNTAGAANVTGGYATPAYNATANFQAPPVTTTQPQFTAPANNAAPVRETFPWENPNNAAPAGNVGFERPVRRY